MLYNDFRILIETIHVEIKTYMNEGCRIDSRLLEADTQDEIFT
jgi:hypothetical protein